DATAVSAARTGVVLRVAAADAGKVQAWQIAAAVGGAAAVPPAGEVVGGLGIGRVGDVQHLAAGAVGVDFAVDVFADRRGAAQVLAHGHRASRAIGDFLDFGRPTVPEDGTLLRVGDRIAFAVVESREEAEVVAPRHLDAVVGHRVGLVHRG